MSSKLFHVLLFKFPKESETIAHTAGDALQDLRTVIPEIQSISFGSTQDNLYEGFRPRLKGYTHAAVLVFNSAEALKTYNFHPAHQKFVAEHVKPYLDPAEDMIVLDYFSEEGKQESKIFGYMMHLIPITFTVSIIYYFWSINRVRYFA